MSTITLSPETINYLSGLISLADTSRYLSAVGLVALLYDHILTFPEEVALIWKAPPSWAKYGFLLNRYMVAITLISIAYEMSGFGGVLLTDLGQVCRRILFAASIIAVCSIGIANILVLVRVVLLWENNKTVKRLLGASFVLSLIATFVLMIVTLTRFWDGLHYNAFVGMCVAEVTTPILAGVWACPMMFEILILVLICWNAVDRPMLDSMSMIYALQRDGIMYYVAITAFRTINMALAATSRPTLALLLVFFLWAMTTLILNRSLLNLQRAEAIDNLRVAISSFPRATSPFGLRPEQVQDYNFLARDVYEELAVMEYSKKGRTSYHSSRWFGT